MDDNAKREKLLTLTKLRNEFSNAARVAIAKKDALDFSIKQINEELKNIKQDKLKKNIEEKLQQALSSIKGRRKKHNFTFLIDGSASMGSVWAARYSGGPYFSTHKSPLHTALSSLKMTVTDKSLSRKGDILSALWGETGGAKWLIGDINPKNGTSFPDIEKGLNSGTDFAPAIREFEVLVKSMLPSKVKQHLVIVSDGDLFDREKSRDSLETLLRSNDNITVDFSILSCRNNKTHTKMHNLAASLVSKFSTRISISTINLKAVPADKNIFSDIIKERSKAVRRKKPSTKPNGPKL